MEIASESTSASTSSSGASQRPRKMPGNLALCRTSTEETAASSECLGWLDGDVSSSSQQPIPAVTKSLEAEHRLNWRYEDGLLRSVARDGYATDLCLGPAPGITSLFTNTLQPYELVLQDCPGVAHHSGTENIFSHDNKRQGDDTATTSTSRTRSVNAAASWEAQAQHPPEYQELQARQLRFLVGGDGRIRSLAPVYDPNNSNNQDLVAEQPFCVTASHQEEGPSRAYLIPCFDHQDETHIYKAADTAASSSERIFQGQQQLFQPDSMTSFRSFLLDWRTQDDTQVQVAYQIGFNGSLSPQKGKTCDQFDAFTIQVTSPPIHDNDAPATVEIPVSFGKNSQDRSGVRTLSPSTLGVAGGQLLQASLVGSAKGGLQTGVLASTSFVVSQEAANASATTPPSSVLPEHWPWAHMLFWGFMVTYAILVKAHSYFRPHHKDHNWKTMLRESNITVDTTAATVASAAAHRQLQLRQASTRCMVGRGRRSRSRSRSLQRPRQLFEWDDVDTTTPHIDGTQTTVISMEDLHDTTTTEDYSDTKLDETFSCSDIEENDPPDNGDDENNNGNGNRYEEYDDDDIESQLHP